MRKINSPCYDGCALILYASLVSNVLQQTWPLLALDFTSPVFPDPTPFILFCLQPPQLPADEAFITAHLPQRKQFAKKDTEAHEPKVLHRTGWGCWKMCSWSSLSLALTVLQPSPPADSGTGFENNMINFSPEDENCTTSFMILAWQKSRVYVLHRFLWPVVFSGLH